MDDIIKLIRAAYRPILVSYLGYGSFYFIVNGFSGEWVDWWHRAFIFGGVGWCLEKHITKIATRKV